MKKLTLFLVALLAFSCLRAEITYELNGGKYNDYGWTSKADMYYAILVDINAIIRTDKIDFNTISLEADKQKAVNLGIPTYWSDLSDLLNHTEFKSKWGWLIDYMDAACSAQSKTLASSSSTYLRYNLGAFFIESNASTYLHAVYDVLGKDAAYIPAWGQNYGNPTDPTEEVTLVEPYRIGYLFDGWYASADFSGEKVTKVDQNTTGTLYAKWVLDGIVYELNDGKYNDYDWTSKADICYSLQADYNSAYNKSLSWAKKENGVVYYNINGTWMTETEAKGQEATVAKFLQNTTYNTTNNLLTIVENTHKAKYGWLKDVIVANRQAQQLGTTIDEALYRKELSAFFLCSQKHTSSYPTSSSYETTGDYEDFQPYWGQAFPNPEHPTAEVVLNNPVKTGYKFLGWYDNEACTGTPITKVDQNTKGTLYAKWVLEGIVYELNGGVWNQYGWESKKDMYDAFLTDWKAYSGSTRGTKTYEEQLGVGKSSAGIPTTISNKTPDGVEYRSLIIPFFTESNYQTKWGWLATYLNAVAAQQSKTQPTTDANTLTYSLGNFFGEDNAQTTGYINAVDFTGTEAHIAAFQTTWGQSFPNPKNPTEEVVLNIAYKSRYTFEGWYDNAECTGTAITTVDENYAGTLYAKWSLAPVLYNLNGGQYNEYGWESKKDVYDDFIADWNTYSGTTRKTAQYEGQLGIGKSNEGIPTTITTVNGVKHRDNLAAMFTNPTYSAKWGWLATYIDAVAAQQGKTQPTTDANKLTFSLGNFFGEDNNHAADYIGAVDFTGDARYLVSAQLSCSFTLPNPTYPTSEVTINNPTKEGYIFDGWYANADFSGAKVTKVNADTKGTLYAKWTEKVIIIDDKAVNSTALAEYNGQIVTAKVTRAFNNDSYKTLTLPFDMNEEQIKAVFGETAIVHEFTSVGEANDMFYLHFDPTTTIEAGKPYILQLPTTSDYDAKDGFTIEGVTINTTPNPVVQGAITMKPILDGGGRLDQASQYWLASDNYLYSAGAHPTALLGLRAYFINSTGRPIRARVVYGENEATSIPTVVAPEDNVRKVLKDGQIIIIRGEKQYNIQGQVIE